MRRVEGAERVFDDAVGLRRRPRVSDLQRPGLLEMRPIKRSVPLPRRGGVGENRPALPVVQAAAEQAAVVRPMLHVPAPVGLFQKQWGKAANGKGRASARKLTPPTRSVSSHTTPRVFKLLQLRRARPRRNRRRRRATPFPSGCVTTGSRIHFASVASSKPSAMIAAPNASSLGLTCSQFIFSARPSKGDADAWTPLSPVFGSPLKPEILPVAVDQTRIYPPAPRPGPSGPIIYL